jgi:hypothetical protein
MDPLYVQAGLLKSNCILRLVWMIDNFWFDPKQYIFKRTVFLSIGCMMPKLVALSNLNVIYSPSNLLISLLPSIAPL